MAKITSKKTKVSFTHPTKGEEKTTTTATGIAKKGKAKKKLRLIRKRK